MAHGDWHDRWDGAGLWWIGMVIVMVAFWGGLIWFAIAFIRRDRREHPSAGPHTAVPIVTPQPPPDPAAILAERLARSEIDPEEYRQRLDALQGSRPR